MTTLREFFTQIAPQLNTSADTLMQYASEDTTGGYVPNQPDGWIVGSVWEVEGLALYAIVRALKPQRILEIGTRRGCSTTHLLSALEANGSGELVSLDIEPFLGSIPEHLHPRWTFVQADALQWLQGEHGSFDLIWEDGAHSYDFTRDVLALCQAFDAQLTISHDAMHFLVGEDIRQAWDDVHGVGTYQTALIAPSDCGFSYQFAPPVQLASDKPIVSIVSGTYNRLSYLRQMVKSVRRQLPDGVPYEFVLVDGGSSDGTQAWCKAQADVRLIEQGELLGAIRAFDAGAEAAQGEYVLLVNDDVIIHDGAVLKALAYLESHPTCGAVAFADDRNAPGYDTHDLKVQVIYGVSSDGQPVNLVYAQVGLFRRWLADKAGWWGSRDPQMGELHTYGGDAYLSARIWELGYTVDAVAAVACTDRVAPDALRQRNGAVEGQIGSAYYRRYPNGVVINSQPKPSNPQPERLRILLATLYDRGFGHYKHGLKDALGRVGWTIEVDWLMQPEQLIKVTRDWQPHLILTQMSNPALMARLRAYAPNATLVNWFGDVHTAALTADEMLRQCQYVNLQLVVNADVLPFYAARGIRAAYWQVAWEPVRAVLSEMPAHDVLFLANAYSAERVALGKVLRELDTNAGLYGFNWAEPSGNCLYDFDAGAALYRRCKIAISDNQYRDQGFVSNRLFEAMANGAFLLQQQVPGLQALTGIEPGKHLIEWTDTADLRVKVRYYLEHDKERRAIAKAGMKYALSHHSFDDRVKELFEQLLPRIADASDRTHDDPAPVADRQELAFTADGIER